MTRLEQQEALGRRTINAAALPVDRTEEGFSQWGFVFVLFFLKVPCFAQIFI